MAKKIKGITVQIGGDTSGLTKALSDADKSLAATQKELNEVQKGLKLDPSNVTLVAQKQELLTQAIADTSSKLKALEDNADKAKKALAANAEWERQFKPLKEQIDKAKESLSKLKAEQEEAKKKFEAGEISAEDFDKVKAKTQEAREALKKLEDQKAELNKQFADGHISEEEYRAYQREVENTRSHLQGLQTELSNTRVNAEEAHKKIADFGTHAKETFAGVAKAAAAVVAAIIAVGTKVLEAGQDFDKSMSGVAATMGYSVDELKTEGSEASKTFEQLRATAQAYGKSTEKSATEASTALNNMAQAGYNAETAMEMLPQVLDLSSAGELELADSSNYVTNSQKALGLTLEETKELIDQMAKASSKTNTKVGELGDGILKIGGTAKTLSGGTRELVENLGVLADNSITAAEGGTHLRNIILSLEKAMEDGAIEINGVKVAVTDTDGEMREMSEVFLDVEDAMSGLTKTGKDTELLKIFNKTDLAAVNAFLGTTAERWDELKNEIEDSAGAAHAMAETKLDNLAGDITLFKSALEGAEITISDKLNPKLRETVQFGTEMVSRLADGFGQGGLAGAVEQAHKVIAEQLGEEAKLVFGIETAVESAVGAWLTYKSVTLLLEGEKALKAMLALTQANTAATEELNAAQMANPFALIMSLAVGVGIAIKKLIQIQTDLIDETAGSYDKLSDEQKKLVDQTKDLAKAYGESKKAFEENNAETEKYAESNRKLVDELYKLNSREKLSKGDKAALQVIVKKLSDSYSGLKIEIDETTGKLLTERDAIEKVIAAKEQEDKANAASEHYVEVVNQLAQAESNRANAAYQREQGYKRLGDLMVELSKKQQNLEGFLSSAGEESYWTDEQVKKYAELRAGINETSDAIADQKDRLGELNAAYVTAAESERNLRETSDEMTEAMGGTSETIDILVEAATIGFNAVADGASDMANSVEISSEELAEKLETTTSKIEELINAYESKLASRTGTLQSWFEVNATVSGEEASFTALSTGLNKQILSFEKWKDDIARLEREGINQNFLDKLKDAGPQSQELVSALLSVPPEKRNKYAETWNTAYQNAANTAEEQLKRMKTDTETQISTMLEELNGMSPQFAATFGDLANAAVDGYINKIKERLPELKEWGKAIGSETMDGEKEETETASPSKKWAELGEYAVQGYEKGIKDSMSKAVSAARKMADDAMNAVSRAQSGGATLAGVKSAGAAVRATAEAQAGTPTAAQIVVESAVKPADIENAVRNVLNEALKNVGQGAVYMDGREVGEIVYPVVNVLQGYDVDVKTRGGA